MYETNQYLLYQNNLKKQNKKLVRKDCNKIGLMLLIATVIMNIVSTTLVSIIYLFGKMDLSLATGIQGIPYSIYYLLNALYEFSGFFIVPLVFCLIFKFKLSNAIPVNNNKRYNIFALVIAGYSICTIANFSVSILNNNLSIFGLENTTGSELDAKTPYEQILYFICVAIVPAFVEEFMFRGVILNYLRKHGDGFAIFVSSLLFGFVHGNFVQIPFAFIVGLVCGFLVVKTGSIIPSILLHLLNNGTSVILDIADNSLDDEMFLFVSTMVMAVLTVIGFIAILSLIKKGINGRFETKNNPTFSLTIKEKLTASIVNPGIMIVLSFYVLLALITLIGSLF